MSRLCERPGCSEPGAAAYGMLPIDLLFWVDHLDHRHDADGRVLCRRHADAMVVPRGWTLDDRREPVPRLFRPPLARPVDGERPASRGSSRRVRSARAASTGSQQLELTPALEAADTPVDVAPAVDTQVESVEVPVWKPSFDQGDDLDGLLEVRTPLLARAFTGAERPRGRDGRA